MSRLLSLVMGPPGHQRALLRFTTLTVGIAIFFALLQQGEVLLGFIDARSSAWLTGYNLGGTLVFYLVIRSGWSARMSSDPSLMLSQVLHGAVATAWSYAITGPARGAVLAILVLLLAFGMFGLSGRQARLLALGFGVALAAVMAWKSQTDPLRYPFWLELIHFGFAVVVLLGISVLSVRMGALRGRLRAQKRELETSVERISLLATQDELTGLSNRRNIMALLKAEQARQQRTKQPLSVALFDLDHFKRVNDTYGHHAGDVVLKGFADTARSVLRGSDVLSRWGGEEFLLMLPDTGEEEAERCVDRIRQSLAGVPFDSAAPGLTVTFSAGLSACRAGESLETAIERADGAMYRAKAQGRNCTVHG